MNPPYSPSYRLFHFVKDMDPLYARYRSNTITAIYLENSVCINSAPKIEIRLNKQNLFLMRTCRYLFILTLSQPTFCGIPQGDIRKLLALPIKINSSILKIWYRIYIYIYIYIYILLQQCVVVTISLDGSVADHK